MLIELSSADLDNIMKIVLKLVGKSGWLKKFQISSDGCVQFKIVWINVFLLENIGNTVAFSLKKVSDHQLAVEVLKLSSFCVQDCVLKLLYKVGNLLSGGIKSKMPDFVEVVSNYHFVVDLDKLAEKFYLPVSFTLHDITLQENRFSLRLDIEDSLARYMRKICLKQNKEKPSGVELWHL